eukprot:scaffold285_cov330-Pavlova_lutheri.AAC.74
MPPFHPGLLGRLRRVEPPQGVGVVGASDEAHHVCRRMVGASTRLAVAQLRSTGFHAHPRPRRHALGERRRPGRRIDQETLPIAQGSFDLSRTSEQVACTTRFGRIGTTADQAQQVVVEPFVALAEHQVPHVRPVGTVLRPWMGRRRSLATSGRRACIGIRRDEVVEVRRGGRGGGVRLFLLFQIRRSTRTKHLVAVLQHGLHGRGQLLLRNATCGPLATRLVRLVGVRIHQHSRALSGRTPGTRLVTTAFLSTRGSDVSFAARAFGCAARHHEIGQVRRRRPFAVRGARFGAHHEPCGRGAPPARAGTSRNGFRIGFRARRRRRGGKHDATRALRAHGANWRTPLWRSTETVLDRHGPSVFAVLPLGTFFPPPSCPFVPRRGRGWGFGSIGRPHRGGTMVEEGPMDGVPNRRMELLGSGEVA